MVDFLAGPSFGRYLDFQTLPKLVAKKALSFEHRGEKFEDTLLPRINATVPLEIQAVDGRTMHKASGLESFLNAAYWKGMQWPRSRTALVLLNMPNATRFGDGLPVGGRYCDVWWFSDDRHTLYSVTPGAPMQTILTRWPPRDSDVYAACPVGLARCVFPLVPRLVQELLPRRLLAELLSLRARAGVTEREHKLLKYIRVPKEPEEIVSRSLVSHRTEDTWDVDSGGESDMSDRDYEEQWDVEDSEEDSCGLWRWVYCMGLSKPLLMRERYREETPCYLDFTEPLLDLVRFKEFGLDPSSDPKQFLGRCLDIVLECCPPAWRTEALKGVLFCPGAEKLLLTAKSCHYLLRAVPFPLRAALGLTRFNGPDYSCKWDVNITEGAGRHVVWTRSDDASEVAPPRRNIVRNTRLSRAVRQALNVDDVRKLTWADLKLFEILRVKEPSCQKESRVGEKEPPTADLGVASTVVSAVQHANPPKEVADCAAAELLESIRLENERVKREKQVRKEVKSTYSPKSRRSSAPKVQRDPKEAALSAEKNLPDAAAHSKGARGAFQLLYDPATRPDDQDLQEMQKEAEATARPTRTFRAAKRNMKRALQREKLLLERLKVQDFFEA